MPIIPLNCPACGAKLEANSDAPILTCKYCGGSFVMKDAIVHNYIQNTINITAETVNVVNQKDFVIEGGVLKKYQGEAMDVVIPDNVVAIGKYAFSSLRIKSVVIPDSVEEIGDSAFSSCTALASATIPSSVKTIDDSAFYSCTALTSITIPGSVEKICSFAFKDCTSLTSVTISSGVKTIDSFAFQNCTSLTSVTFPGSVEEIDDYAFGSCSSLTEVNYSKNKFSRFGHKAYFNTPYQDNQIKLREQLECERRAQGKCLHCGGDFKGMFSKVCTSCGKPKDY